MVEDDLFGDDENDDFNSFSSVAEPSAKKRGGAAKEASTDQRTLLENYAAEVNRRIAVLRSVKQSDKLRIAAAKWLGESGDISAIKALIQVYRHPKSSRGLRKSTKKALAHFKALDDSIFRDPDEAVEDALSKDENQWVIELLTDLAVNEERPKSRGRTLLLMNGMLAILLALLFVIYQYVPEDAVSINQLVNSVGATALPTATPTPAVDEFGNPLPTATATFTPTATSTPEPTFTPTATEVTLDHVRVYLREMYSTLSRVDSQGEVLSQLRSNWERVQADAKLGPPLCLATPPVIPEDVVLPAGVPEREPALAEARDWINTGLAATRDGWRYWTEGCAAGNLPNRINNGLQSVLVAKNAFDMARSFLNLIAQ